MANESLLQMLLNGMGSMGQQAAPMMGQAAQQTFPMNAMNLMSTPMNQLGSNVQQGGMGMGVNDLSSVAAQQLMGPIKSVSMGADGTQKFDFHPPTPPGQDMQLGQSAGIEQGQATSPSPSPEQAQQQQQAASPEQKKATDWGNALMMLGFGLQGKNPYEVLQGSQKTTGTEPIQPLEQAGLKVKEQERQAAIYSAQVTAFNEAISREENMQKGITDQMAAIQKANPMALFSPQWNDLNKELIKSRGRIIFANQQFGKLATNPPKKGGQTEAKMPFSVGEMYNGHKITSVREVTKGNK